jgi:predicted alpha/beta-hydrolase family hydrolase
VEETLKVEVGDIGTVTAVRTRAEAASWTFIYAPGAGSNLQDPFGAFAASWFAERGVDFVRFQFLYMERGRSGPDRPPVLEAAWRAVIDAVRPQTGRLAVGGRSMGGRIASQVVAQGVGVNALVLFAYPLHPPGRPEQIRDDHLPQIDAPALFCSGDRDDFGSVEELRAAAEKMKRSRVHVLAGANHGFSVRKSSGRTQEDVWREAVEVTLAFLNQTPS